MGPSSLSSRMAGEGQARLDMEKDQGPPDHSCWTVEKFQIKSENYDQQLLTRLCLFDFTVAGQYKCNHYPLFYITWSQILNMYKTEHDWLASCYL